jgi:hypothetical protein
VGLHSADVRSLRSALRFHAGFDGGLDAGFARGDKALYSAASFKALQESKAGLHDVQVEPAPGAGRFGDALRFTRKNTKAVYFKAANNAAIQQGTISFWLRLDPDRELEPGYCDPIQLTAKAFNDDAIWVDFTKDDTPRHFRLGVFGSRSQWNPQSVPEDKNPDFLKRLVVVSKPPFQSTRWVHVVITHSGLGSGSGNATLFLDGEPQGTASGIREKFEWDAAGATIRLGVNYVGLFDELAVFERALDAAEVKLLHELPKGVAGLYK